MENKNTEKVNGSFFVRFASIVKEQLDKIKMNKFVLSAGILGVIYFALRVYTAFSFYKRFHYSIGLMQSTLIIFVCLGVAFSLVSAYKNKHKFALAGAIMYTISAVYNVSFSSLDTYLAGQIFVISVLMVVFAFVGYSQMKKSNMGILDSGEADSVRSCKNMGVVKNMEKNKNTCLNVAYIFGIIGSVGCLFLTILTLGIGLIWLIPNIIATNLAKKASDNQDKSSALTSALLFLFFGNFISMIFAFVGHSQLPNVVITQVANSSNADCADALLKYKTLLDDGVITPEEFEAKKKEILNV